MLHVPAPLCHLFTDLAAKMYGFMPRTVRQRQAKRAKKKTLDGIDRWIETKNVYLVLVHISASSIKVSSATTKDFPLPPKVAPCYALFEMPIRFAIEFAVNRQPQIESGVMWKLENILNAICEFKRSLLTTDAEQRHSGTKTRLCWLWERRIGVQSGRRKFLCFLSDITGPVHSSRSRKLSRSIRIHKTIFRDPSM